jgi:hypothetical protein
MVSHDSKFFVPIVKSSCIKLCVFFNEDDPSFHDVVPISMNS